MGTCRVCSHLINNKGDPPRSESLREWYKSAAGGCPYCSLIVSGLDLCEKGTWCGELFSLDGEGDCSVMFQTRPLCLDVYKDLGNGNREERRFYFYVGRESVKDDLASFEPPFSSIDVMGTKCQRPGGSADCLTGLSRMLQRCITEHTTCPRENGEVSLPKRVIDVGDPAQGRAPRLVETQGELGKYICLSHRWGWGVKPLTTLTTNLEERLQHIPVVELPKNFSDCLDVARALGVQYVWIDSLCIVQDSTKDWQEESAKMADVYGNCYVCITASGAANAAGGLSYADHHAGVGPFLLDRTVSEKVAPSLDIYVLEIPFSNHYSGFYSTVDGKGYELHRRAWCQQEFFLPARVIQFGKGDLQWDCATESFTCHNFEHEFWQEAGVKNKFVPSTSSGRHTKRMIQQSLAWKGGSLEEQERKLWDRWRFEVEMYSTKDMTVESDRLPAFSGIAQRFAQLGANPPYLAGIWLADAWRQLCWTVVAGPGRRPDRYRAPTFSWASVHGKVRFAGLTGLGQVSRYDVVTARTVQVLGGGCEPEYGDAFGAVKGGYVTLRGQVLMGLYEAPKEPAWRHVVKVDHHEYPFELDVVDSVAEGAALSCLNMAKSPTYERGRPHETPGYAYSGKHTEGYAFLVVKSSELDVAAYERVGWGWANTHNHEMDQTCQVCQLFDEADSKTLKLL